MLLIGMDFVIFRLIIRTTAGFGLMFISVSKCTETVALVMHLHMLHYTKSRSRQSLNSLITFVAALSIRKPHPNSIRAAHPTEYPNTVLYKPGANAEDWSMLPRPQVRLINNLICPRYLVILVDSHSFCAFNLSLPQTQFCRHFVMRPLH